MTQEVLEAGPKRRERRVVKPAVVWTVGIAYLVVFSVLATGALILFTSRTVQADRLMNAVEASEAAMGVVQAEVAEVFAEFEDETLTEEQRAVLLDELRDIAAQGEESIAVAGEGVADVRIWSVNPELRRAQDVYLLHNLAWQDYLARAAEDPIEFITPQPDVNSTFFDAQIPLWESIPGIDLLDLSDRVRLMYADSGGGEGFTA